MCVYCFDLFCFFVFLVLLKRNLIQILILLWVTHFNLEVFFFLEVFRLSFLSLVSEISQWWMCLGLGLYSFVPVSTSGSFQFAYSCFSWTLGNFLWYYFLDNILLYIFSLSFFSPVILLALSWISWIDSSYFLSLLSYFFNFWEIFLNSNAMLNFFLFWQSYL